MYQEITFSGQDPAKIRPNVGPRSRQDPARQGRLPDHAGKRSRQGCRVEGVGLSGPKPHVAKFKPVRSGKARARQGQAKHQAPNTKHHLLIFEI